MERDVNHVANLLAKAALHLVREFVLLDKVPDCIKHLLVMSYANR